MRAQLLLPAAVVCLPMLGLAAEPTAPANPDVGLTRQWRAHERQAGLAPLPMVSLTAHAFASDVQASLDAGSNLHLAKPFSRQQLLEALNRLAPAARAPAAASSPTEASTPFDPVQARQRLGSEPAAYQRLADHAAVFLPAWLAAFSRAQARTAERIPNPRRQREAVDCAGATWPLRQGAQGGRRGVPVSGHQG